MALPLNARRSPIFYGWYIVAVAVVAQFVSAGTQAYAVGVFLKPMTQELGWSRQAFSAVQTVSTFVSAGVGLFIGVHIDRRGPRQFMIVGGLVSGSALIGLSTVHSLWQFYLIRGVGQTIGSAMLGNLVVNVTVVKWFVARRGLAVSIASAGVSLGGVLMAPLVSWWVTDYGWRTGWVILGILVWCLILPSALVMRRRPEDFGLHPDGMEPAEAEAYSKAHNRPSALSEVQWTLAEAVRTKTLWFVILAYGVANIGLGAMLLHTIPFLTDHGFSPGRAVLMFSVLAWTALLSKPVWGVLMDRVHARYLSAAGFAISAASILGIIAAGRTGSELLVVLALGVHGFGFGGTIPLQETVWASYFGRAHLGRIRAVAVPFSIVFGAGGPLLAGTLYDRTGGYTLAFTAFAAFYLAGLCLILLARPPRLPLARAAAG